MNTTYNKAERESLILRVVWTLVFFFVWQVAEVLLLVIVVAQLLVRLFSGKTNETLLTFGDSLSQYLAQIGRYATFNTDRKPWPMTDWPSARPADVELVSPAAPETPKQETQP